MSARIDLSAERGTTLIEMLVVIALMIPVLSVTLGSFELFDRTNRTTQLQNDAQDQARTLIDRQAKELRNLASPQNGTADQRNSLDKLGAYDIIFKTVDPVKQSGSENERNVRRVRYCVEGGTASPGTLWAQSQTWIAPTTPPVPAAAAGADAPCPDRGDSTWQSTRVAAENIVNRYGGADRPIWSYNAPLAEDVTAVREALFVDVNPGKAPLESKLSSGVFLRNQNREPVAAISVSVQSGGRLLLNGSASTDPEGRPLTFAWTLDGGQPRKGIVSSYEGVGSGPHTVELTVKDGSLLSQPVSQEVTVP